MINNIKKVLIIENPKSGQGNSGLNDFKILLLELEITVTDRMLGENKDLKEMLSDVANFDCVVTAGGDGTVCAVSHIIMNKGVPIFVFPAGTANLVAQNLGMSKTPEELIKVLMDGPTMAIDIPVLTSSSKTMGFIVAAGAGFDAEMIKESESMKASLGTLAYVFGALKQAVPKEAEFTLTMDGKEVKTKGICALVANLGMINFKIPLAEGIDPTDGLVNVIIFKGASLLSLTPNIIDSIKHKFGIGETQFDENLEMYTCRKIKIESDPTMPVQYDGEVLGEDTPITIEVMPKAVNFFYADPDVKT